jgi:hypothetical protein
MVAEPIVVGIYRDNLGRVGREPKRDDSLRNTPHTPTSSTISRSTHSPTAYSTMSSDWWGNTASPSTPLRQNSLGRSSQAASARFNDELDAEDARMADGVKFLPSFSTSTAGKLLSGSSVTPGGGLGMSSSSGPGGPGSPGGFGHSPPGMSSRRSPNTRFGDAR